MKGCAVDVDPCTDAHIDLNVIVPDREFTLHFDSSRAFNNGPIELPNLISFGATTCKPERLNLLLNSLTLPSLQYFELTIYPTSILPCLADAFSSIAKPLRSFLLRTNVLRRLHIRTLAGVFSSGREALAAVLLSVIPHLTALERLDITTDIIPFFSQLRSARCLLNATAVKALLAHSNRLRCLSSIHEHYKLLYPDVVPSASVSNTFSDAFRREHPEPWAVYEVTEIQLDCHYPGSKDLLVRHTAELSFDKLGDDLSFVADSYDFFAEFLSRNPFPSTELDLCYNLDNSAYGSPNLHPTPGDGDEMSTADVLLQGMDSDDDSCSLEDSEYVSCEEFGESADED
ncbi:hypothetical protein HGRIS_007064 [Hohenbuehelia grisea]|uniref:Uncharacterized protein n=1 Tax=Hohenbuehelia grisea TaxID=104357 RepID=A0ABR3JB16_9AGAR